MVYVEQDVFELAFMLGKNAPWWSTVPIHCLMHLLWICPSGWFPATATTRGHSNGIEAMRFVKLWTKSWRCNIRSANMSNKIIFISGNRRCLLHAYKVKLSAAEHDTDKWLEIKSFFFFFLNKSCYHICASAACFGTHVPDPKNTKITF